MWIRKSGGGGGWEAEKVAMLLIRQLHGKLALCLPRAPSTFPLRERGNPVWAEVPAEAWGLETGKM